MALKVTERDKKLLTVLGVFAIIIVLGVCVLLPFLEKGQQYSAKLVDERIVKTENQQKVQTVEAMKKKDTKIQQGLADLQSEFYPLTPSMEIDRMLTGMALSHGAVVSDLEIEVPPAGNYAELVSYPDMLKQLIEESIDEEAAAQELKGAVYEGCYSAAAKISMTGSRDALQAVLDECAALEPKARIAEFLWEKNSKDGGGYTLSMDIELYMSEDTDQYMKDTAVQEAVKKDKAEPAEADGQTDENAQ